MAEIVRELAAQLRLQVDKASFTLADAALTKAKADADLTKPLVKSKLAMQEAQLALRKLSLEARSPEALASAKVAKDAQASFKRLALETKAAAATAAAATADKGGGFGAFKERLDQIKEALAGGAEGGFGGISGALQKLMGGLGGPYVTAAAGAVAITAGLAGGMFKAAEAISKTAGEVKIAAAAAGISTTSLQRFNYALGTDSQETSKAFSGLSRRMADAKRGSEEVATAFRQVGVKVTDSKGQLKSADAVMMELADKFQKMPDGAKKSALASKLLGEELGPKFIYTLTKGSAGLKALMKEADEFGLVLDAHTIKSAGEFHHSMKQMHGITQGLANVIGAEALPFVNAAVHSFVEWYKINREIISQRLQVAVFAIGEGFKFWWSSLEPVIIGLQASLAPLQFFMDLAQDIAAWADGGESLLGNSFMYLTEKIKEWTFEAESYFGKFKEALLELIPVDKWLSELDRFLVAAGGKLGLSTSQMHSIMGVANPLSPGKTSAVGKITDAATTYGGGGQGFGFGTAKRFLPGVGPSMAAFDAGSAIFDRFAGPTGPAPNYSGGDGKAIHVVQTIIINDATDPAKVGAVVEEKLQSQWREVAPNASY